MQQSSELEKGLGDVRYLCKEPFLRRRAGLCRKSRVKTSRAASALRSSVLLPWYDL